MTKEYPIEYFENNGVRKIRGIAATSEFISNDRLTSIHKRGVNQPIIYRHVHPASPVQGDIYGYMDKVDLVEHEGKTVLTFEATMLNEVPTHEKAWEYIRAKQKQNDPVGISVGFLPYNKIGCPFEFSLTRMPVIEDTGVITMGNEKIAELEGVLDKVKKENVQKEKELKEALVRLEKAEVDLKDTKELLEANKSDIAKQVTATVSAQMIKLEDKYKQLLEDQEKAGTIVELFELNGNEWDRDNVLPGLSHKQLLEKLKYEKTRPPTSNIEISVEDDTESDNVSVKLEKTRAEFMKSLNENAEKATAAALEQAKRENG